MVMGDGESGNVYDFDDDSMLQVAVVYHSCR